MISFVPLLEGDICSPSLWWDHSELADHRNCCTSAHCRLGAREASLASLFFFFPHMSYLQNNWKRTRLRYFLNVALCLALHGAWSGGREDEKRCGTNLALVPCNCSETESQWRSGLQNTQVGGGRAVSFSCTCGILDAPYDFCFCLEKSFLQ